MQLKKYWYYLLFVILIALFCYFRVKPILLQTIPYTFDQGRDFLQAEKLAKFQDIALSGPPAGGVGGVFHGAWWYYILVIPYVIFGGNPSGFPFFIFLMMLASVLLFIRFLDKEFNTLTALFFLSVVTVAPYFIFSSFFVINSVLTLPFILLLFYSLYELFKTKNNEFVFFTALSLGFIFEAELPFGLFLLPSFLLTVAVTRTWKLFIRNKQTAKMFVLGTLIPSAPRLLYELTHGFHQSGALVKFLLTKPDTHVASNVFKERLHLFTDYYQSIFPDNNFVVSTSLVLLVVGLFLIFKSEKKHIKKSALYFTLILFFLFTLSLVNRSSFFWANYFEGIQYFFVILLVISFYAFNSSAHKVLKLISHIVLYSYLLFSLFLFSNDVKASKPPQIDGLIKHTVILNKLHSLSGKNPVCARIYTPPVIPYTYEYLFNYYSRIGYKKPVSNYIDNQCYYIIERDDYQFRIDQWRKDNIPKTGRLLEKHKVGGDVLIELWQEKPHP